VQSYIESLKKYAVFSGRASRAEFWKFMLFTVLILPLGIALVGSILSIPEDWLVALTYAFFVAVFLPGLAVTVRRLHDAGRAGAWLFAGLLPVIGEVLLLVFLLQRSTSDSNDFESAVSSRTARKTVTPRVWSPRVETPVATGASPTSSRTHDSVERVHRKTSLRHQVAEAQELLFASRQSEEQTTGRVQTASRALEEASGRLRSLESGRGTQLASLGQASLYEFWIELPGYSGPVRGATARITRAGDIQHVSKVTSSTKSGLGGAVAGGLLLGPVGAIVGNNMARKTTVQTNVTQVDTRQSELEVIGPGFAWSTRQMGSESSGFTRFRDLANARGASADDPAALVKPQSEHVDVLRARLETLSLEHAAAASSARQANETYGRLRGEYRGEPCSLLDWIRAWTAGARPSPMPMDLAALPAHTEANASAPAGWYPDPSGAHQHRYWDGAKWSATVADHGHTTHDPV